MPGGQRGQRKQWAQHACHRHAARRLESVPGNQRAVTRVEQGDVARCVPWRGHHPQRADRIAVRQGAGEGCLHPLEAAPKRHLGFAWIQRLVTGQEAGVTRRDQQLSAGQQRVQRVHTAHMVAVGVGQDDPLDGRAQRAGCRQNGRSTAADAGIDQGEAVVFPHEVDVDQAETGQLGQIGTGGCNLHGDPP